MRAVIFQCEHKGFGKPLVKKIIDIGSVGRYIIEKGGKADDYK